MGRARIRATQKRQAVDFDFAGRDINGFALARQIIGAVAVDLDGGKLRRNLLDETGIARQEITDRLLVRTDFRRTGSLPLHVVGRAFLPPGHGEFINLAAIHDVGNGLRRIAKGNRQHTRCQGIERARMTSLLRLEQPLDLRNRLGRTEIQRLVEDEPAGNGTAFRLTGFGHLCTFVKSVR